MIFCTGYTSAVEALTDCGAMALMKPYSADVLERVVAERLQLARDGVPKAGSEHTRQLPDPEYGYLP